MTTTDSKAPPSQDFVQQIFDDNTIHDQYSVGQTSFHIHNGIDSQRLFFRNLIFGNHSITTTWSATGNTNTVNDNKVSTASFIVFMYATAPAGRWAVVPKSGSFTITSSDVEAKGLSFQYAVL